MQKCVVQCIAMLFLACAGSHALLMVCMQEVIAFLFLISPSPFSRAASHPPSQGKLRHGATVGLQAELGIRLRFAEAQADVRQRAA